MCIHVCVYVCVWGGDGEGGVHACMSGCVDVVTVMCDDTIRIMYYSLHDIIRLFIFSPHSPYQDDFVVLHVREEYDTVLETVLKTEFLTLLSEKYTTLTQSKLSFTFNRRYILVIYMYVFLHCCSN